jgi:hypothetical protein
MRDNLHKSETKDQNEKGTKIQGGDWSLSGTKLKKLKVSSYSRGVIEWNHKLKD